MCDDKKFEMKIKIASYQDFIQIWVLNEYEVLPASYHNQKRDSLETNHF